MTNILGRFQETSNQVNLTQMLEERGYLVFNYTQGTICDLTGEERETEVQIHCNLQSIEKVTQIRETSTCKYLIVFTTPRLCVHPLFTQQQEVEKQILCNPLVSDQEYSEMLASYDTRLFSRSLNKKSMMEELREVMINAKQKPALSSLENNPKLSEMLNQLAQQMKNKLQNEMGQTVEDVQILLLNPEEVESGVYKDMFSNINIKKKDGDNEEGDGEVNEEDKRDGEIEGKEDENPIISKVWSFDTLNPDSLKKATLSKDQQQEVLEKIQNAFKDQSFLDKLKENLNADQRIKFDIQKIALVEEEENNNHENEDEEVVEVE